MADIEHKELPDDLLHEPKGASSAAAGTVYVADGNGSGTFKKLIPGDIDAVAQSVEDVDISNIDDLIMITATSLTQVGDGTLQEVIPVEGISQEMFNTINKNTAELYRLYLSLVTINQDLKMALEDSQTKINEIITALRNWGIVE